MAGAGAIVVVGLAGFGSAGVVAGPIPHSPTIGSAAFEPVALPTLGSLRSDADRIASPTAAGVTSTAPTPTVAAPPAASVVSQTIAAPKVVRFRPRDGWTDVDRGALLSVRFTAPMDRRTTAPAFRAVVGGREIRGRTWWAEDDTVLVLDPRDRLPAGAAVTLSVATDARSSTGVALGRPAEAVFVTATPALPRSPTATTSRPATTSTGWVWPLKGPITQRFGESLTRYGVHRGIDIDGDTGDPVRAARAGVVTVAGYADKCGGIQVRIDHGDGFVSWYRHLSATDVSVAQRVARGSTIGRVGSSGCSTGSHLHFAITKNGVWTDPGRYLPPR